MIAANSLSSANCVPLTGRFNEDGGTGPLTPLTASVFIEATLPLLLRLLNARNLVPISKCMAMRDGSYFIDLEALRSSFSPQDARTFTSLLQAMQERGPVGILTALPWTSRLAAVRIMWRVLMLLRHYGRRSDVVIAAFCVELERARALMHASGSSIELAGNLVDIMRFEQPAARDLLLMNFCAGFDLAHHALTFLLARGGSADAQARLLALLAPLPPTQTAETERALEGLLGEVRHHPAAWHTLSSASPDEFAAFVANPQCPVSLRAAVDAFMAAYGHRGEHESDLAAPRWSEEPAQLYALMQQRARISGEPQPAASMPASEAPLGRQPILTRVLVRAARQQAAQRDNSRFYLLAYSQVMRQGLLRLGKQFVDRGRLVVPDDIFWLDFADLVAIADGLALDGLAAHGREQKGNAPAPQSVTEAAPKAAGGGCVLRGIAASPGVAVGRAVVVRGALDLSAASDHPLILLAAQAQASWAYLLRNLAGVALERGGTLSHFAITAREFGVPLVLGVEGLLDNVQSGDEVMIDGSAGCLTVRTR
jgi:phosphohistidine swiveling domain-containing protein